VKKVSRSVAIKRSLLAVSAVLAALAGCNDPPQITGINPNSGPLAGGTVVGIAGHNFDSHTQVVIAGRFCSNIAYGGSAAITATTPPGPAFGSWNVEVINRDGQRDRLTGGFTYTSGPTNPTISSIAPPSGSTGTQVTISGTGFQTGATVTFGSAAATNVVETGGTQITATAPSGSGAVVLTVTNPDGGTAARATGFSYGGTTTGASTASSTITTAAGSGARGFLGDGGPATSAELSGPSGVALAVDGSLFVADTANNRIRQISTSGTIETVAGGASAGWVDGAATTVALLDQPRGVAVAASGALLIADTGNNAVRSFSSGQLTTVAGGGAAGNSGDGGLATAASFSSPHAVSIDAAGSVYVADTGNNRIRRIDASTRAVSNFAGSPSGTAGFAGDGGPASSALFSGPQGLVVDESSGIVYVSDTGNARVRRIDSAGVVTTFAGTGQAGFSGDGGPAGKAALGAPEGLAFDAARTLYIADTTNERVRTVLQANLVITTFAGNGSVGFSGDGGPATSASLNAPAAVVVNATTGTVFFADSGDGSVRQVH
jgi:sugar lactone lactonase YvrE